MSQQTIGIGAVANDGTGDPFRTAFTKTNSNFAELYGRVANAADYGAVADGSTSLHTAINAAIADGVSVLTLDETDDPYVISTGVSFPSNFRLVAGKGRPQIQATSAASSRMFMYSGVSNCGLFGLYIDGNKAVTPTDALVVTSGNCSKITIRDCIFVNLPGGNTGGVVYSTGTTDSYISFCQFEDSEGTAVGLNSAAGNIVSYNQFRNSGGWAVGLQGTSYKNLVVGNNSFTSGLEAYVTQYASKHNRIINNYCELTGDNGISISGFANVVSGNVVYDTLGCGIGVWGSENSITGNVCKNSNNVDTTVYAAGIWLHGHYGGTGSFNTIVGNVIDDDRGTAKMPYGIRIHGSGYSTWAAGQVISSLSDFSQVWRVYGLNVYLAKNIGTTGATPPTHTTGIVSDGTVSWEYVTSFTTAVGTLWNNVSGNIVRRYKTGKYYDQDNWSRNTLSSDTLTSLTITADGLVRAKPN